MFETGWGAATGGVSLAVALPYWLDREPTEAMKVARAAEEWGYDELWIGEMATFDAFTLAGAIARETTRIKLVVGPLPVTLRDPVSLAMASSSIAELGGRPTDLVLGASSPTVLSEWHGVDKPASLQAFDDALTALRKILRGDRTDYSFASIRSSGFKLRLAEHSPTRLGMAAFGPKMIELAAERADRVVVAHVTPDQTAKVRRLIDDHATRLGRSSPPTLSVWMAAALNDDQVAQVMRGLVTYVGQRGYSDMFEEAGFAALVDLARFGASPKNVLNAMPVQMAAAVAGIGTPDHVLERIRQHAASGANQVCLVPATAGDETGSAVLRAIRSASQLLRNGTISEPDTRTPKP